METMVAYFVAYIPDLVKMMVALILTGVIVSLGYNFKNNPALSRNDEE